MWVCNTAPPLCMFPSLIHCLKALFDRCVQYLLAVPPSPKEPTNSLRIDRFLRPFTLKAVQELLGKTGNVTSFWMDHIKTHCYVSVRPLLQILLIYKNVDSVCVLSNSII